MPWPVLREQKCLRNQGDRIITRGVRNSNSLRVVNVLRVVNSLRVAYLAWLNPLGSFSKKNQENDPPNPKFSKSEDAQNIDLVNFLGVGFGIIERGVPQAYVRARASSATLCSVRVLRAFLSLLKNKGI